MPWAIALRKTKTGAIQLYTDGMKVDEDDPEYDQDVHIVPCFENGDDLSFGVHDFTRQCCCHPRVDDNTYKRNLVIHSERVN